MSMKPDEVAEALGASRSFRVSSRPTVPFGILQLQAELAQRLRPSAGAKAGRPSDPEWTLRRLVGFRPESWKALAEIAAQASTPRRRVSPGQVAARLIEDALARIATTSTPPARETEPEAASSRREA